MFGYPVAFLNGNMLAGVFQDRVFLRLSPDDRVEFGKLRGAGPFEVMPGRAMKEYMLVPEAMLGTPAQLDPWLVRSRTYVAGLPNKARGKGKKTEQPGTWVTQ